MSLRKPKAWIMPTVPKCESPRDLYERRDSLPLNKINIRELESTSLSLGHYCDGEVPRRAPVPLKRRRPEVREKDPPTRQLKIAEGSSPVLNLKFDFSTPQPRKI